MPTLYLTNRPIAGVPTLHIQARPQSWLRAIAPHYCPPLCPQGAEVEMMQQLVADRQRCMSVGNLLRAYHTAYNARLTALCDVGALSPDILQDSAATPITGDVTLLCTCAKAEAQAGRCHRAWAAPHLKRAGWSVILDGVPL